MVALHGEKMSKSKGNLELVSRLRETGRDPMAIRLALLAHHYRSDWEWTDAEIITAEQRLAAWRAAVAHQQTAPAAELVDRLRAALADDLDAPAALAAMDQWAGSDGEHADGAVVRDAVDALLGVDL
jgi:L-cysteine:1D-myo-inositol 2-amino-2-deoxy-alpha-D-glucopyranoside ligase